MGVESDDMTIGRDEVDLLADALNVAENLSGNYLSGWTDGTPVGQYPFVAATVLHNVEDAVAAQQRLAACCPVGIAFAEISVMQSQAGIVPEGDPCHSLCQWGEHLHLLVFYQRQRLQHIGEVVAVAVEEVETVVGRDTPDVVRGGHLDVVDAVGEDGAAGLEDGFERVEGIAVEAYQPVPCGKPHEAGLVLLCIGDMSLQESVVGSEVAHPTKEGSVGRGCRSCRQEEYG